MDGIAHNMPVTMKGSPTKIWLTGAQWGAESKRLGNTDEIGAGRVYKQEVNGIIRELAPAAQVVRCRSAIGGTADPVRTAVALQAHHNCGVLAGPVEALLPTAGGV